MPKDKDTKKKEASERQAKYESKTVFERMQGCGKRELQRLQKKVETPVEAPKK